MIRLTDQEILDRYTQSLGEGRRAVEFLARFVDPTVVDLKGPHIVALKQSLEMLEGCARQIGTLRRDARWTRLAAVFGRARIMTPKLVASNRWDQIARLKIMFEGAQRSLIELDKKTGVPSSEAILPKRASEWLWMPPPLIYPTVSNG